MDERDHLLARNVHNAEQAAVQFFGKHQPDPDLIETLQHALHIATSRGAVWSPAKYLDILVLRAGPAPSLGFNEAAMEKCIKKGGNAKDCAIDQAKAKGEAEITAKFDKESGRVSGGVLSWFKEQVLGKDPAPPPIPPGAFTTPDTTQQPLPGAGGPQNALALARTYIPDPHKPATQKPKDERKSLQKTVVICGIVAGAGVLALLLAKALSGPSRGHT